METPETSLQDELAIDIQKAITVITENRKASASFLQSALKISYGRAVKIMAKLEEDGIVGPANGGQPRPIYFDKISSTLTSEPRPEAIPITSQTPPATDGSVACSDQDRPPGSRSSVDAISPVLVAEPKPVGEGPKANAESGGRTASASLATGATSEIKLAVIAYLPPVRFNTLAFLENLKRNPPAHELITFSDDPSFNPTVAMKRSIEIPKIVDKQHGVANLAFYLAFGQAWKLGYSYFLYLESDCRQKSNPEKHIGLTWDQVLLTDFAFAQSNSPAPLILGGTQFLWNPLKTDAATAQRANELMAKWNKMNGNLRERNRPVAVYGARRQKREDGSGVGCNGAGAIYSVEGLRSLFPELKDPSDNQTIVGLANSEMPFDHCIARRLWNMHRAESFDRVAHLPSMFSSFADTVSTEEERLEMLRSGSVVLVHSIKSQIID